MIMREKIILSLVGIIIFIISIDFFLDTFFDSKKNTMLNPNINSSSNQNQISIKNHKPLVLSINSWGNDIFYNRSYKYKSWFNLTGITQFEDGNKAIINENIFQEKDKIKGFTILKIADNYVLLKRNKHKVTLKINE